MLAIKTFGLLWERKYIHWGWGRKRGHLQGYREGFAETVDFREQRGIYVLYNKDTKVVYVGQTGQGKGGNLFGRLRSHTRNHLWNRWEYFSWFGVCGVNRSGTLHLSDRNDRWVRGRMSQALNESEGILMHVVEPHLNKQGARWKGVQEYYQFVDADLDEPSPFEMHDKLDDIEKKIGRLTTLARKALLRKVGERAKVRRSKKR